MKTQEDKAGVTEEERRSYFEYVEADLRWSSTVGSWKCSVQLGPRDTVIG